MAEGTSVGRKLVFSLITAGTVLGGAELGLRAAGFFSADDAALLDSGHLPSRLAGVLRAPLLWLARAPASPREG